MARDPKEVAVDLLEGFIRPLPFDEKLEVLAEFARTGKVQAIVGQGHSEHYFAFHQGLEKVTPSLSLEDAEGVARKVLRRIVEGEIDRRVAERETEISFQQIEIPKMLAPVRDSSRILPKIVIADDGRPLMAAEFSEFLRLFNEAYELAANLTEDESSQMLADTSSTRDLYLKALEGKLNNYTATPQTQPLIIRRISKSSPVSLWIEGIAKAVTFAAIVSGGTVKLPGVSFKLPAIGDGLMKLKALFSDVRVPVRRTTKNKAKKTKNPAPRDRGRRDAPDPE
jgi:hypothetical protein